MKTRSLTVGDKLMNLLLGFRRIACIPQVQLGVPVVYQLYMLLCLLIGFRFGTAALPLVACFAVTDLLMALLIFHPRIALNGQILCAVNLLFTTGLCAQSVFVLKYPVTSGMTVSENVISNVIFLAVGAVCGGLCVFVCWVLGRGMELQRRNAGLGEPTQSTPLVLTLAYVLGVGVLVLSVAVLAMDSLWLVGNSGQPSEFLKFALLFYLAFVAGLDEDLLPYRRKLLLQVLSYLCVALAYAGQSEFGSLLVVSVIFALFLLICNKNWLLTGFVVGALAVVLAVILSIVIHFGNLYIEEKYGSAEPEILSSSVAEPETEESVGEEEETGIFDREYPRPVQAVVDLFTSNYEKIYMRFMVCIDIDGTRSTTSKGVHDAMENYYAYQARAALQAIGISRFVPTNAPVFKYVPIGISDYIYTSVLQTGGYISIIVMLLAFVLLADASFCIVSRNCPAFCRYLVFVMIGVLQIQMFINVLGVNNCIPLTGITLPFVSRGGTSLTVCTMMIATVFYADMTYNAGKQKYAEACKEEDYMEGGVHVEDEQRFTVH